MGRLEPISTRSSAARLVVPLAGDTLNEYEKWILVHELTHALMDQHFPEVADRYETASEDGDFDDYIELLNRSASDFDLSGYYLSDNPDKPKKWQLPKGTSVPAGGYLLIWADGNKKSKKGLHASFKLDKTGETIVLCDRDERDNQVLDRVTFAAAKPDLAHCRVPDGAGPFVERAASPNAAN